MQRATLEMFSAIASALYLAESHLLTLCTYTLLYDFIPVSVPFLNCEVLLSRGVYGIYLCPPS